ncbi:MAG: MinD-like ATPase involved in chromosome partitioning or flagellar assembly [Verrucomicrobiales bacterium]|jgi:MinD-like ATPase involved in chromosome partitioning or flagellar assembly
MSSNQSPIRVVFTEGGKGGVGKTEIAISLATWYQSQGISPRFIDFDTENTDKSGLKNFVPDAVRFDIHTPGALDHFFEVCDTGDRVVLADMGAGAGSATYDWFEKMFDDSRDMNIRFTAIGVTTNDPGAVLSVLRWAKHLQQQVDYLIVLNETSETDRTFEYWHDNPLVRKFAEAFKPVVMRSDVRIAEFQSELRNQELSLDDVIERRTDSPFFRNTMQIVRARRYQRTLYTGFDSASDILLPTLTTEED